MAGRTSRSQVVVLRSIRYGEADRLLTDAAAEEPQSAAVAVALAATQTAEAVFAYDFPGK